MPKLKSLFYALGTAPILLLGATDVTFFAVSDTHYGTTGATWIANRKAMPDLLNSLPGQNYPALVGGGVIGAPKGLLMAGDLVDRPDIGQWKDFLADYGIAGEGRFKYPVYDGLGNHDGPGTQALIVDIYKARNRLRLKSAALGIADMDSAAYNFSWDWDQVHFVNLNLFSGSATRTREEIVAGHSAFRSLDFLKADLARHVGRSGRPVFIMQHYSFDGSSLGGAKPWWSPLDADATYQVLKDYNVVGLLHGHSHGRKIYKWNGIDVFDDGTAQDGDAFVFRITDGRMFAVNRVGAAWGTLKLDKSITMGEPVSLPRDGLADPVIKDRDLRLSIPEGGRIYNGRGGYHRAEILDLSGRILRTLVINGSDMHWDGRTGTGHLAPAGIYTLRLTGSRAGKALRFALP